MLKISRFFSQAYLRRLFKKELVIRRHSYWQHESNGQAYLSRWTCNADTAENLSDWPASNAQLASNFSLSFMDSACTGSVIHVKVTGPTSNPDPLNGHFIITFNLDSVKVGQNQKVAYPAPGVMTIEGTFNNVGLIN